MAGGNDCGDIHAVEGVDKGQGGTFLSGVGHLARLLRLVIWKPRSTVGLWDSPVAMKENILNGVVCSNIVVFAFQQRFQVTIEGRDEMWGSKLSSTAKLEWL